MEDVKQTDAIVKDDVKKDDTTNAENQPKTYTQDEFKQMLEQPTGSSLYETYFDLYSALDDSAKGDIENAALKLAMLVDEGWEIENAEDFKDYLDSLKGREINNKDKEEYFKSIAKPTQNIRTKISQSDKVSGEYLKETNFVMKVIQAYKLVFSKTLKVFFGNNDYFNITTKKQKALKWGIRIALAAVAVTFTIAMFNPVGVATALPFLSLAFLKIFASNIAITAWVASLVLPKYIAGKTDQGYSKVLMSSMMGFFAVHWGGYLGGFFIQGIFNVLAWTLPAIITTSLSGFIFFFLAPLTFESIWQAGVAIFAQMRAIKESTTTMAKLKAVMDQVQVISIASLVTFLLSAITAGSLLSPFLVPVSLGLVGLVALTGIAGMFLGTSYTRFGWNSAMKRRFKEFEKAEQNGTLLPDGRICKDEMIRFIDHCTTMSMEEREQFKNALNGKGKFPYPKDSVAREQIIETIKNMAARKAPQLEYAAQPTMGVHVMAGSGEDYRKNIEFLFKAGSWDKNTTYAGHIAVEYPQAWSATIDKSTAEVTKIKEMLENAGQQDSDYYKEIENILEFIDSLRNIQKGTIVEMPKISSARAKQVLYDHLFYNIENEIGELRSYDGQVMLDVARQIMQAHYSYANEFADTKYTKALDFVSAHYNIIKVADEDYTEMLNKLGARFNDDGTLANQTEVEAKLNEMLKAGDEFAEKLVFAGLDVFDKENIESIKYFLDKYNYVDEKVRTKQSFTLFEGPITNYIELDENGIIKGVKGLTGYHNNNKKALILEDLNAHKEDPFAQEFIKVINDWEGKTLAQYAKEISDFRTSHITEFADFVKKYDIEPDNWELGDGFIRMMQQTNDLINIGVYFPWKVNNLDQQWTFRGKNNNMAFDLAEFAQVMSIQDALVGLMYGQEIYDRNMACEYMQRRRSGNIQLNPSMLVPGADRTSPSAFAYGYAQDVWMNSTQKALSGLLTFYGKGIGDYHFAGTIIHTGEDSFMFMIERAIYNLQSRNQNKFNENSSSGLSKFSRTVGFNNTISSERLEYRTFLWQRPAAYSGGTEQRYLWNVMLYLTEGTARNINFGDSSLGYDVKVANSMLWQHYLNIPLVVFMLTAFSVLIFFSSFAHLLPFIASVGVTMILMQGINFGGIVFASSQTDGITGMGLSLKRILQLLPYFNSMFGTLMEGFVQGVKQMFGFTPTKKNLNYTTDTVEGMAKTYSKQVQFGTKVFMWLGIAITTFIFLVSIGSPVHFTHFLASFFCITIWYFAAGVANMTGPNAYRAKVQNGTVKGSRIVDFFIKMFASIPVAPITVIAFMIDNVYMLFTNKSFMVNVNSSDIKNKGLLEKWFSFNEHGTKGILERNLRKQLNLETIYKGLIKGEKANDNLKAVNEIILSSGYTVKQIKEVLDSKDNKQIANEAKKIISELAKAVKKDKTLNYENLFAAYKSVDAQWTIESDLSYSLAYGYKGLMNINRLRKLNFFGKFSTKYYCEHYEALVNDGVISEENALVILLDKYSKTKNENDKAILKVAIEKMLEKARQTKINKMNKALSNEKNPDKKTKIEDDIEKMKGFSITDFAMKTLFDVKIKEAYGNNSATIDSFAFLTSIYPEDRMIGVQYVYALEEMGIFNFAENTELKDRLIAIVEQALDETSRQIASDEQLGRIYTPLNTVRAQFKNKLQAQQDLKDLLDHLKPGENKAETEGTDNLPGAGSSFGGADAKAQTEAEKIAEAEKKAEEAKTAADAVALKDLKNKIAKAKQLKKEGRLSETVLEELKGAASKIVIKNSDSKEAKIAKIEELRDFFEVYGFYAGGKHYDYRPIDLIVFELQSKAGFGLLDLIDPSFENGNITPYSVKDSMSPIISYDYLQKHNEARNIQNIIYMYLNGGLGESVKGREPVIFALNQFKNAMNSARATKDIEAVNILSDMAKEKDLFGRYLTSEQVAKLAQYGFVQINPYDFYDVNGKAKKIVTVNGKAIKVPALTGKATDTPFVVKLADGTYEFRSIMDIKMTEMGNHEGIAALQIVGPGGEVNATEILKLIDAEESLLDSTFVDGALQTNGNGGGILLQERYYAWKNIGEGEDREFGIDFDTINPGGHGTVFFTLFSSTLSNIEDLLKANNIDIKKLTKEDVEKLMKSSKELFFGNGDGLNSAPTGRIGAATMTTVPRTDVDAKGGMIVALKVNANGKEQEFPYLLERGNVSKQFQDLFARYGLKKISKKALLQEAATFRKNGQEKDALEAEKLAEAFDKYGIKESDDVKLQPFNTNGIQFNNVLMGLIMVGLMDILGEKETYQLFASPTITSDKGTYTKYEWAIGQTLLWGNMNLEILRKQNPQVDNLLNTVLGKNKQLATVVMSSPEQREEAGFTPFKFVKDILLFFKGGFINAKNKFSFNKGTRTNVLGVTGTSENNLFSVYYDWAYFDNQAENFVAEGNISANHVIAKGNVTLINDSAKHVDVSPELLKSYALPVENGKVVLENVTIVIDETGMSVEKDGVALMPVASAETKTAEQAAKAEETKKAEEVKKTAEVTKAEVEDKEISA